MESDCSQLSRQAAENRDAMKEVLSVCRVIRSLDAHTDNREIADRRGGRHLDNRAAEALDR